MIFYEKWQQHLPKKNPGPKCPGEEEEEKKSRPFIFEP
jgi:hypothetical protein